MRDTTWKRADIEFDLPHRVVRMFTRACAQASAAYWGAASVVPMGPRCWPRILVPVHINGKPFCCFRLGAVLTQLDVTTAAEVSDADTPGVTVAGTTSGLRAIDLGAFESFVIFDESVARPNLLFGELGLRRSLLLGADFLLKHRVLIAHSQRKVYFSFVGAAKADETATPQGAATDAVPMGDHNPAPDR